MPKKGEETHDEPVSPGSKMSAEYSLDEKMIIDDKSPSKMSNKSPQKQPPPKASGKTMTCSVYLLDGENVEISLDKNDVGRALFEKVCSRLDLIERDYFGLTYTDDSRGPTHLKYWLNLDKKISKQKKRGAWVFEFALKFYPPDPAQLRESLTRWLVVLQVRRDLLSGRIPCTFTTYALLGSYNVQADVGEYDPTDHGHSYDYIKDMAFAPNQTPELLEKIAELHKLHKGQTPDEAEKGFLDNAKKLAMYGIDLHKAKDSDNNAVMIGVCCSGLLVFRDKLRLNRFVWPKILKLSYKRNHFYIKIRPGEMERNETTIMFKLDNHRLAKRLWKTCVEHHAFFRLREAEKPTNNVTFPRFGSKFRYSGRTLYQTRQTAALLDRPPPFFERSQPARNTMNDTATRSRSMDELGHRRSRSSYDDGMYDGGRGNKAYDPNRYGDEKDRKDLKGVPTAFAQAGRDGDTLGRGDENTLQRRPIDSDTADRRDRLPSQGDATLDKKKYDPGDSMGLTPGIGVDGQERPGETDRERRKREKEEEKKRKKEAEEKKKMEEEEKKKNKKKGKGDLDTSEDRTDKLGQGNATEKALDYRPGSVGVDGDKLLLRGPLAGEESTDDKDLDKNKGKDGYNKDDPYGKDGYDKDGRKYPYGKDGFDKDGKPYGPNAVGLDKDGKEYPYGKDGKGYPYGKDGKGYPYGKDGKGYPYGKDGQDENGEGSPYGKDGKGYPYGKDGKGYPHGKDGKGYPYGTDGQDENGEGSPYGKDGKGKDGKDKDKDKKGGGLFGRLKKSKPTDGEADDKVKGGKGDKDKDKGKKGGLADVPDVTRDNQGNKDRSSVVSSSSSSSEAEVAENVAVVLSAEPTGVEQNGSQGNLLGTMPGFPYGVGLGVGKGDMTGVVGDEKSVDNKQRYIPVPNPVRETKESLKSGYTDNMMPFFNPAATSTVGRAKVPPPVPPKGGHGLDDSFNPPTVATEKVKYNPNFSDVPMSSRNIPLVKTETRTVTYERDDCPYDLDEGTLVSAKSHSTRLQTIETTTYKTEKDGIEEMKMVQKVVMSGDEDDDFDFDAALADAIRTVTQFNPDMSVERIECVQQIEDVKNGK